MDACFNSRMAANIKNELVLPDRPTDFSDAPDHLLLILFASRCGSSYAGHLLANTPHFKQVREAFNTRPLARLRLKHKLADDGETARWVIANHGTKKAFAAKCGQPGLIGAWQLGYLEAVFDRTTCLVLERRDRVAQAVSLFRAELSGRYHSPQSAQCEVQVEDYDREKISICHNAINNVYDSVHRFLALTDKPYRTVYYEDLCADPQAFVNGVCADMKLSKPAKFDAKVRLKILRDEVNAEWVDRFKREQ